MTIIQFPLMNQTSNDQELALALGRIALWHERIHRTAAQIFKSVTGHATDYYQEGFDEAHERTGLFFRGLNDKIVSSIEGLLVRYQSLKISDYWGAVEKMSWSLGVANELRNAALHSSYGLPDEAQAYFDNEVRAVMPLAANTTIRERVYARRAISISLRRPGERHP